MDTSPTALFDSYEQDFKQFIETIREKLEGEENQDGEQRKASLRRVEMELDEADEMASLVSQMDIEMQGIPQSIRSQYQARLRTAKADLSRYKKMFKDLSSQLARSSLLASSTRPGYSSDDPYGTSDRARLLAGTTILEDGTKRLQESQRLALETEEQGTDILMNLRIQREQIENSRNTLEMANSSISRASNTLSGYDQKVKSMYQQRFVTGAIIAILVLLIIIVVWSKLS
ncbi:vesicle transport v-snare protein vti1 [Gymnopus androsaceus JB14]|uniref:Vesicle transport v-snare protein vti1 n=1 Tax=Gymnopus androsaceus JB14 TaxID=1447944 RepID=A0A6A4ILC6_9AGAR|nr:vesicle transport v-snare protein vti1 [Gymnopus androsaceus JB14]